MRSVTWILVGLAFCTTSLCAQLVTTQDPKALELFDKADVAVYSAKRAGLKDVSYRMTLSTLPKLAVVTNWTLTDGPTVKLDVASDAESHVRIIAAEREQSLLTQGALVLDMVIGTENRATYVGDEVSLAGPNQVRIVAKSERSKNVFTESMVTYDAKGLPVQMRSITKNGSIEIEVAFEKFGELHRVQEVRTKGASGTSRMVFSYQEVGGYLFPKTIDSEQGSIKMTQAFSDFAVDRVTK